MCPAPIGWGMKRWWPSSVCLSVLCLTLSREWKGVASCKLAGMKTWHEWPVTPYRGRKVEDHGPKPINADTENATYIPKGRSTNFKLGTQGWSMMIRITDMHGDVKGHYCVLSLTLSLTLLIGVCCMYCISCVLSAFNKRKWWWWWWCQDNEVMTSVWCVFAHNSTTKCRKNSKIIGRKVVRTTADIPH